jgi:hypothetical protein
MSMTAPQPQKIDPLHALVAGGFVSGSKRPIPLVATRFDVNLNHGLAIVSATRTFRNAEESSIEATITFPMPVHAVLFNLETRIDGRVLKARAQRRSQARDTYEDAIERGKTAVLHEEVLRGVHMLSVGHVPAGAEIEVSAIWTMTLTNLNGRGQLRIPLTVGDIYGRSGLPDSDDLTHGGPVQSAELTVQCRDGEVTLLGGRLNDGRAQVPLKLPSCVEARTCNTAMAGPSAAWPSFQTPRCLSSFRAALAICVILLRITEGVTRWFLLRITEGLTCWFLIAF